MTKVGSADWHEVVKSAVPTLQRMVPWGHLEVILGSSGIVSWAHLRLILGPSWGRLGSHLEKYVCLFWALEGGLGARQC